MSNPIPQLIDIRNTLSSTIIQQIRADILNWKDRNEKNQLLNEDIIQINRYLSDLANTLNQFIIDNRAIVHSDSVANITEADVNLFNGLVTMYRDYMTQLEQLKTSFNYQNAKNSILNIPMNSANNTNPVNNNITTTTSTQNNNNTNTNIIQRNSKPIQSLVPSQESNNDPTERIIDHITNDLPRELAKDRKIFINKLIKDTDLRKSIKINKENPDDDKFLLGVVKLCSKDVNIRENIMSYLKLLKLMGYSKETLKEKLPSSLTKPKVTKPVIKPQSKVSKSMLLKNSKDKEQSPTKTKISTNNSVKKKIQQPKPEIYIADPNSKKTLIPSTINDPSSSSSSPTPLIDSISTKEDIDTNKKEASKDKKISFSKYLKKDDPSNIKESSSVSFSKYIKNHDTKEPSPTKRSNEEMETDYDEELSKFVVKKMKIVDKPSILKSSINKKKTSPKKISFHDDNDLVRVYGDDLPNDGLKVTPVELKKILRPFVEGEPNERLHLEGFRIKLMPINLDDISNQNIIQNNDISEIKGGVVRCDTAVPALYRSNFSNFNIDLKNRPPREPVFTNEDIERMNNNNERSKPIIAKAFGKNRLLLRNDRGGIPYKRVPEVPRNHYPIKYIK